MSVPETQASIATWADDTFGKANDPSVLVDRALVELAELKDAIAASDTEEVGRETADILILLYRILEIHGLDAQTEIDAKMAINRARTWLRKGDGTGSHID